MAKTETVSNEIIIAALIQHGTIKEAAEAVGLTPRAVYDRMKKRQFAADRAAANLDIVRLTVIKTSDYLSLALDTAKDIMTDETVNPATRLQAAQTVINTAIKTREIYNAQDAAFSREYAPPTIGDSFF